MTRAFALAALALCACGDNEEAPPQHDGSRLKLVDYVFDDGARMTDATYYYDDESVEFCSATLFADGHTYCMPASAQGTVLFTDERCTSPIGARQSWEADPPRYFVAYDNADLTRLPRALYRSDVDAKAPANTWTIEDGTCTSTTTLAETFYELGAVVPESALVRLHESSRLVGPRIEVGLNASEDGLVGFGSFYDRLYAGCVVLNDWSSTDAICTESPWQVSSYYADAACTEPLASAAPFKGVSSRRIVDEGNGDIGCWSVYDIGDPIDVGTSYVRSNGQCVASGPPGGPSLATSPSANGFARMSRTPQPTDARVWQYFMSDGDLRVPTTAFFDSELGIECTPSRIGDELLCLPAADKAMTLFSDPTCTTPLKLTLVAQPECAEKVLFARDDDGTYPIDQPYTPAIYEHGGFTGCSAYQPPAGWVAHALGPAISYDSLPHATIEVQR